MPLQDPRNEVQIAFIMLVESLSQRTGHPDPAEVAVVTTHQLGLIENHPHHVNNRQVLFDPTVSPQSQPAELRHQQDLMEDLVGALFVTVLDFQYSGIPDDAVIARVLVRSRTFVNNERGWLVE